MEHNTYEELVDFLKGQPLAKTSLNGKQVTFKCPYCHDLKSANSTNFSVSIDITDNKSMIYQCFRAECLARGRVDQDFLNLLGFDQYDVIMDLTKHNRKAVKLISGTNAAYKGKHKKAISNVVNTIDDKTNVIKLRYINNRLGLNLTYKDIYALKINLDCYHLLKFNQVNIPSNLDNLYKKYGDYGVSFISAYNDYVIIRDISKDGRLPHRYNNVNIFNNYDDATKMYVIPTKIDLLSPERTVLNVSEGALDMLGVFHNLDIDREYKNQIHAAACGAGLTNVVMHYIREYGLTNIKINVFSDDDVKIKAYQSLNRIKPYVDEFDVNIYYNTISKDYGVPKEMVNLSVTKL